MTAATLVPQPLRHAGKLSIRTGETVEAEFRIYASAEGGDPLWSETQRVTVSEDGSYSVLLGSASSSVLPQTVFAGGVVRWLVDKAVKKAGGADEGDVSPGSLYASGLIAAGGIMGLLGVAFKFYETTWNKENPIGLPHGFLYHDWVSVIAFAALAFSLYYFARKPVQK